MSLNLARSASRKSLQGQAMELCREVFLGCNLHKFYDEKSPSLIKYEMGIQGLTKLEFNKTGFKAFSKIFRGFVPIYYIPERSYIVSTRLFWYFKW